MIGKKIRNPEKSNTARVRIEALVNYLTNPQSEDSREKCVYQGALGFFGGPASHKAEMIALAECSRSRDPVNHYVLSWPEEERPTPAQADEAVVILVREFGMPEHQVIYALHDDTDNRHLHIVINRVDPETEKCTEINKGFDIEALHQAVAQIEKAQGWKPEKNARYQVTNTGELLKRPEDPERPPAITRSDMESATNEKSAQRQAQEQAWPVIKTAGSWQALHQGLADIGLHYEKKGSGALIHVGPTPVKASKVNRGASLSKLQARLGPYQPPNAELETAPAPEPEPARKSDRSEQWEKYRTTRAAYYDEKRNTRAALNRNINDDWEELKKKQKEERESFLNKLLIRNTLLGQLFRWMKAREQRAEREELKRKHQALRLRHKVTHPKFPSWKEYKEDIEPVTSTPRPRPGTRPVRDRDADQEMEI